MAESEPKFVCDASNNDLSELRLLIGTLRQKIRQYSHVSDYLHQSVEVGIDRAERQINREIEKRGF